MVDLLTIASAAMVLANMIMFILGPRLRQNQWYSSMLLIVAVTAIAWLIQGEVTGRHLPITKTMLCALLLGGAVVLPFRNWNPPGHAAFAATIAAVASYIGYAGFILAKATLGPWSLSFGLILLFLQISTLCLLIGTMFETIDVVCRTRWHGPGGPKPTALSHPKVSIHVPTYAEPPEMVIETLNALARMDYTDFEVLVIDNNTVDESLWKPVEAHCAKLGNHFRFFHLMPWPGYKSGALNFAIGETSADAELIAVIDADYIVDRNFLQDLVGHFDNTKVAFVQTPQDYRDGEDRGHYGRALCRAYMYFFQVSMLSRNETNSIIYAGTMGLIRKSALVEVGGWSEWCITEDAELSLRLLTAGYMSVYVQQTYGRGLMPLDLAGLKKQRFRWAFGGMQLLRLHFATLANPFSPLTFAQRFGFINGGLQWLNDLLSILYTIVLLVGTASFIFGGTFFNYAFIQSILIISLIFLFLSILRFLRALSVQSECSWRDAADAMSVLIGLTWVVGLACARGLFSQEGVFLRTPKQSEELRVWDAIRVVRVEALLAAVCLAGAIGVALTMGDGRMLVGDITIGLLIWQAATFLASVRLSFWSHVQTVGQTSDSSLV
jgi:cellulose synthase/poly-beta-1,6-N-acetylglucosamine synthase-like glycosyltransferase